MNLLLNANILLQLFRPSPGSNPLVLVIAQQPDQPQATPTSDNDRDWWDDSFVLIINDSSNHLSIAETKFVEVEVSITGT
jgi:hypothetical protein